MRGTVGILTGKGPACDGLQEWLAHEIPTSVQVLRIPGNQIPWQRNYIIQRMRFDDPWVLFVDADCIPPIGAVKRLLSHDVGVIGGLIVERVAPLAICAVKSLEPFERYRAEEFPMSRRDLQPVVSVGTGFMMIQRPVIDALPKPWFRCGQIPGGEDLLAEDLSFCLQAAQVGFPVFLDPAVRVGHETKLTVYPGDAEVVAQFEGPVGALPYRVPVLTEVLRDLHL